MAEVPYRQFQCATCGEIYDEAVGSPADGIAPGTRFEDLPADWICPACGAAKDQFALLEG